jgi:hypothetical protein
MAYRDDAKIIYIQRYRHPDDTIVAAEPFDALGALAGAPTPTVPGQALSSQAVLSITDVLVVSLLQAEPLRGTNTLRADVSIFLPLPSLAANAVLSIDRIAQILTAQPLEMEGALDITDIISRYLVQAEPLAGTNALGADMSIGLSAPSLAANAALGVDFVASAMTAQPLEAEGNLSITDVLVVLLLPVEPLSVEVALFIAGLGTDLIVPSLTLTAALAANPVVELRVTAAALQAITALASDGAFVLTDAGSRITYECVLTGDADGETDLTIPMSSFQGRFRSGDPSYLAVNVPSMEYAADITARSNGSLSVYIIKTIGDNRIRELLITVDLEDIRTDEGANSQTITLSGHRTETPFAKTVTFDDVYYANMINGLRRFRCPPDLYLKPGDTVVIDGETMTADLITWAVSVDSCTMEIAEEGS